MLQWLVILMLECPVEVICYVLLVDDYMPKQKYFHSFLVVYLIYNNQLLFFMFLKKSNKQANNVIIISILLRLKLPFEVSCRSWKWHLPKLALRNATRVRISHWAFSNTYRVRTTRDDRCHARTIALPGFTSGRFVGPGHPPLGLVRSRVGSSCIEFQ